MRRNSCAAIILRIDMTWLVENWMTVLVTVLTIIGAASVAVKAIAPFTKTSADDKFASFLDKLAAFLGRVALNPTAKK
jgi:hypothetical protein